MSERPTGSAARGVDFYDVDGELSEEERLTRDTVRAFVNERAIPILDQAFVEGRFPSELIPAFAGLGLLGSSLSGYGCAGANSVMYGLICQELERGDSGLRSFVSVQSSLVMYPIHTFGTEEQKEKWLPRLAAGEAIGCFGLTEADHGSDPGTMLTRAERRGAGWVIRGAKAWITNGSVADVAVVWAKTEDGIRGFLVEKGTPGFAAHDYKRKFSLRASVTSELFFDDCEVPGEALLPGTGSLKHALMCLTQARYGIAWGTVGMAAACYEAALDYANDRIVFGRPVSSFQLQQAKLADMLTEITKGQLLNLRLGRLKDQGRADFAQVSMAKRNGCRTAREAAHLAREILGAAGIVHDSPVARHFCNIEAVYTYEGTDDIHTLILGDRITGKPAYQ
ncbi:MAG: acyl-CoA dehydrogenase family protein [Bacteroidales bacterium]